VAPSARSLIDDEKVNGLPNGRIRIVLFGLDRSTTDKYPEEVQKPCLAVVVRIGELALYNISVVGYT
jgi:hypothetical protein